MKNIIAQRTINIIIYYIYSLLHHCFITGLIRPGRAEGGLVVSRKLMTYISKDGLILITSDNGCFQIITKNGLRDAAIEPQHPVNAANKICRLLGGHCKAKNHS